MTPLTLCACACVLRDLSKIALKTSTVYLSQEPADLSKQFPDLAEDFHVPQFFTADQFFSSVFRISSCGLQLWTHYDVGVSRFLKRHVNNKLALRLEIFFKECLL